MSGVGIRMDVSDGVSAEARAIIAGLGNPAGMHEAISTRARNLVINHLTGVSLTRHATAQRLGAAPTRHWEDPASYTAAKADSASATISIRKAGIGRAAHDVTILPGEGKKWLTIPLVAEAYGQRAYRMEGLFFVQPKGKDFALLGRRVQTEGEGITLDSVFGKNGKVQWLYLLKKTVRQKQDRTLLPSDDALRLAALEGLRDYLAYIRARMVPNRPTGGAA